MDQDKVKEVIATQAIAASLGAASGAIMKHALTKEATKYMHKGNFSAQVGSAMGAAARNGKGVSGTVAAGTAVVTAKAAVIVAGATVAAPFVAGAAVVGAVGYGIYRLFKNT